MSLKMFSVLLVTAFVFISAASAVFSQEPAAAPDAANPAGTAVSLPAEGETQWQYVEVVSVDPLKKEIRAKYIDYETDEVKEIALSTDDKTTYENVISIAEIKPQDTAGVDYIVTPDGKSLARNISVEKAQEMPMPVPAPENAAAPAEGDAGAPANP